MKQNEFFNRAKELWSRLKDNPNLRKALKIWDSFAAYVKNEYAKFAKLVRNAHVYIKSKFSYKYRNKVMPVGYAMLIVLAFVLSLTKNNDVSASVTPKNKIDYILLENSINNNLSTEDIYPQSSIDNIRSLFEMVNYQETTKTIEHEIKLSKGDTFINILTNLGMGYKEAHNIYLTLKKVYKPENLKAGQVIFITTTEDTAKNQLLSLDNITISPKIGQRVIIEKNDKNEYVASLIKDDLIEEVNTASGTINGNLSSAMNKTGVPNKIVANFINIFSYSVDFKRDIKKGDKFEIIYENYLTPDGKVVKTGNIEYAALQLGKHKVSLYRYKDKSGNVDYFDEKGYAMKKTLHRKPLAFQSARISSPFGKRRHPIKKKIIVHWGVDYAAPKGAAIYAAGDGVVQMAKWNGGYGNYIKIRHNAEYSTAYGHMSRFAKGIRAGKRVKQGQVIGYVGSTGLSTGPHLHYEVVKNGRRVNPLKIKAAAGENLAGKELKKFKAQVAELKRTHSSMFAKSDKQKVASK